MYIRLNRIIDLIGLSSIVVFGFVLWGNLNLVQVPNPDIFEYIDDSHYYTQFTLPQYIQVPPAVPLLIGLLSLFLHSFNNPEMLAAHMLNISASIAAVAIIYYLIRLYSRIIGLFILLLLITNPLFVMQSLDVNTEVPFLCSIVLTLLLYQKKKFSYAYLTAGFSSFIRYEAIVLLPAMAIVDAISLRSVKKVIPHIIIGSIPVFILMVIVSASYNFTGIWGNSYIQEVVTNQHKIPHSELFTMLPYSLVSTLTRNGLASFVVRALTILCAGILLFHPADLIRLTYISTFLYIIIHSFFPFAPERYLYPVLWSFYLSPPLVFRSLFSNRTSTTKKCVVLIICLAVIGKIVLNNVNQTFYALRNPLNDRFEDRLVSEWLDKALFTRRVVVLAYDPWIINYYTTNKNIEFPNLPYSAFQQCNTIQCVITTHFDEFRDKEILFVQKSGTLMEDETFPSSKNFNSKIFNNFPDPSEEENFILLTSISTNSVWAHIYQYRHK